MDTVLVTGGCGYIGSHTCIALLNSNYNILIIDSLVNSFERSFENIKKISLKKGINNNERIQFIKGDLRNKPWLENVFGEYAKSNKPIKKVIHFAGLKSILFSIKEPLEYWDTNVNSTLSLLSAMKKFDCYTLIFSSSATVYKPNGSNLLKETDPLLPLTPYGRTKFCIEKILGDLFDSDKRWKIANLRYFNPVGSHSSGLLQENTKGKSSNLFPEVLKTIRGKQKELSIFGNDWPTKDGTCIRDFIHVMDLAEAHIATLDYLKNNNPQYVSLNIGTGKGISVLEVIKAFQSLEGISFKYDFVDRRLGDQPFLVADNQFALKLLCWAPKRNLFDMCNDSITNNKIIY